jgi:hypothetical protein
MFSSFSPGMGATQAIEFLKYVLSFWCGPDGHVKRAAHRGFDAKNRIMSHQGNLPRGAATQIELSLASRVTPIDREQNFLQLPGHRKHVGTVCPAVA